MGFLKIKSSSIYLEVTNQPKLIRPLFKETEGRWCHSIPSCKSRDLSGKQVTLRKFSMVDADFSQWMKNNPDPLWDKLDGMDQTNQKGERRDFPLRPMSLLPVWDYNANDGKGDVKMVKQGNQFFEEMVKYYDQGGDVTNCDWMCWTEGEGRRKNYKTSRQDKSPFNCPISQEELQQKCQEVMEKALSDLRPFKTEEELLKFIRGESDNGANTLPQGQGVPQNQMPNYQPGGQSPGPQLGTPALPPANNPPQPQNVQVGGPVPQTQTHQQNPNVVQPPNTGVVPNMQQPQAWSPQPTAQQVPMPAYAQNQQPQGVPTGPQVTPSYTPQAVPQQSMPPQNQPYQPQQQQQDEVANAPISGQPVYAAPPPTTPVPQPQVQQPPQPQQPQVQQSPQQENGDPRSIVVQTGKHAGKTLGWVFDNDNSYLSFLKGHEKQLKPAIEALLSGDTGGNGAPAPQQAPAPAPQQAPAGDNVDQEATRQQLVQAINEKCFQVPEFQGPGIANNMMPFLEQVIGTTNFSDAPLPDLQKLNAAIDAKLGAGA